MDTVFQWVTCKPSIRINAEHMYFNTVIVGRFEICDSFTEGKDYKISGVLAEGMSAMWCGASLELLTRVSSQAIKS